MLNIQINLIRTTFASVAYPFYTHTQTQVLSCLHWRWSFGNVFKVIFCVFISKHSLFIPDFIANASKTVSKVCLTSKDSRLLSADNQTGSSLSTNSTTNGGQKLKDKSHSPQNVQCAKSWAEDEIPQWGYSLHDQLFGMWFVGDCLFLSNPFSLSSSKSCCLVSAILIFWPTIVFFFKINQKFTSSGKELLICECDKLACFL